MKTTFTCSKLGLAFCKYLIHVIKESLELDPVTHIANIVPSSCSCSLGLGTRFLGSSSSNGVENAVKSEKNDLSYLVNLNTLADDIKQ